MTFLRLLLVILMAAATSGSNTNQQREAEHFARLLYGENRQDLTPEEATAIVHTARNRTRLAGYPSDLVSVLLQKKQYSPFDPSDPNFPVIQKFGPGNPDWERYLALAKAALDAKVTQPYTHYFTGRPPVWASALENQTTIGSHTFGTERRRRKRTTP